MPDPLDVADDVEELVGLLEERELLHLRRLVERRHGVEVIRNRVERGAGAMVLRIEEVLEELGGLGGIRHRDADELHGWIDLMDGAGDSVVFGRVLLGRRLVLEIRFVQDLPVADLVVMWRVVRACRVRR